MLEPDRILEGLHRTLEQTVLPAVASGFARGQLQAVLEVLGSLQGQLHWGGMLLENEAAALADLAAQASTEVGGEFGAKLSAYAADTAAPLSTKIGEGRALVCALIESGAADQGALAAAVDGYLANDAIFKAMALRPSRLAEISQG